MARIQIDHASPVAAYEQIVNALRALLVAGDVKPGETLSPVRRLALDLGVHHNTVAEAYRVLAREGWLDVRRGRGAVVLDRQKPKPEARAKRDFHRQLRELLARGISAGLSEADVAVALEAGAIKLRQGGKA